MVCTKLKKGICKITKKKCDKSYEVKMAKYKDCPIFKRAKKSRSKSKRKK